MIPASPILLACLAMAPANPAKEMNAETLAPPAQAVRVSIAVPEHFGKRSISQNGSIHVVITNAGGSPVALWREWCSWGYFNLTFEIVDEHGAALGTVQKKLRGWTKNYPDWLRIEESEHAIRTVNIFDDDIWETGALFNADGNLKKTIRMRAVFSIPRDQETDKNGVWVGTCASPVREYVID